ncbi:MAG: hypothetical protein IJV48_04345 [Ruminococcus sp.]|nr:hypothetical protein [Ruminococcus sp.]
MKGLQSIGITICFTCAAVSILSVLIPQKRTGKIMTFVIGVFFLGTVVSAVITQIGEIDLSIPDTQNIQIPTYSEDDYNNTIAQMTADNVTASLNDLLMNEGIQADDIKLTLKISDEGRISVVRAVIYINEVYRSREADIESIIYRNVSKEPEIYVTGEEAQ